MEWYESGLPPNPLWTPGEIPAGGRLNRAEDRTSNQGTAAENAVGEVLRQERIALWRDLYLGKLRLERENKRLRHRIEILERKLARKK